MSAGSGSRDWVPEPVGQRAASEVVSKGDKAGVFSTIAPYPAPIGADAYFGIAGELVRMIEPHTEADPSFLLVSTLVYAGNLLGRNAYVWAGGDRHYPNLFAVGVGSTSSGRKGSAHGPIDMVLRGIDEDWAKNIQSGLSSGEGLIYCVRDPIKRREKTKKKGQTEYKDAEVDPGIKDKRLLVRQSEFFGALQAMRRQGNTLSPVIRDAWDRGDLNSMVKNSPVRATGAHISIIGNITKEELLRGILRDEADNGFANRFLWCCSVRSKALPEGGQLHNMDFSEVRERFKRAWHSAKKFEQVERDEDAADLWGRNDKPSIGIYADLNKESHGLFALVTARAAPQVLRLSLIYALLDGSNMVRERHLLAAYEVWRYCRDSARYIFGDTLGDPMADEILNRLRRAQNGLTRVEIRNVFDRHKKGEEIDQALMVLHNAGLARFEKEPTGGRPSERWFATAGGASVA